LFQYTGKAHQVICTSDEEKTFFEIRYIKDGITSIALTITGGNGNVDVVVVARKPGVELRAFDILQH